MIKRNMLLASAMFCTIAAFAGTEMSVYQGSDVSVRVVNPEAKMKFGGGKITFGEDEFATFTTPQFCKSFVHNYQINVEKKRKTHLHICAYFLKNGKISPNILCFNNSVINYKKFD